MMRRLQTMLLRPYIRRELPGWGVLFHRFVSGRWDDAEWAAGGPRLIRGKLHGYLMRLDLGHWAERTTYFLERFSELPNQLVMIRVLREGDRFVDVGANIGMLTLLGARLVGPGGRVDAVEPNPRCAERIREGLLLNRIEWVNIHEVAAGDHDDAVTLHIPRANSGEASVVPDKHWGGEYDAVDVAMRRISDVLPAGPVALIKIDVEGFEASALRGLSGTLAGSRPAIITEMVDQHLIRVGSSSSEIFELLGGMGYTPFGLGTRRVGLRHRLELTRARHGQCPANVLWLHEESEAVDRLADLIPGPPRVIESFVSELAPVDVS